MKHTLSALAILTSLLFIPGVAFAQDKCRETFKKKGKTTGANLRRAALSIMLLARVDLFLADFEGVTGLGQTQNEYPEAPDAILRRKKVRGVDLSGKDLQGVDLSNKNLRHANFRWANLREADLRGADLIYADFEGANLEEAYLQDANLWRVKGLSQEQRDYAKEQGAILD